MYNPSRFHTDHVNALELIGKYPFATMIAGTGEGPFISHLPIMLTSKAPMILAGHMARANPQWKILEQQSAVTVIFHGPHSYITPTWYVSGRDVPTWAYAVVHAHGRVRLVDDFKKLEGMLADLSTQFDSQWEFHLPDDLSEPQTLSRAIVGFEITVDKIDAKFKLNQSRPHEDQTAVITGLRQRGDENSKAIADLMSYTLRER